LKTQMRLVKIYGQPVDTHAQFRRKLIDKRGRPVVATFIPYDSAGKLIQDAAPVKIKLSARPSLAISKKDVRNLLGFVPAVRVAAVADTLAENGNAPSPAKSAGIKPGDVLARAGKYHWPDRAQLI